MYRNKASGIAEVFLKRGDILENRCGVCPRLN